jgi:hypothetical protein
MPIIAKVSDIMAEGDSKNQQISSKHRFDKPIPLILPSNTLPPYKKPDIKNTEQGKLLLES